MRSLKGYVLSLAMLAAALPFLLPTNVESQTAATEAPTGFDNQTNGCVDQATHNADRAVFEDVEGTADGLGACAPGSLGEDFFLPGLPWGTAASKARGSEQALLQERGGTQAVSLASLSP